MMVFSPLQGELIFRAPGARAYSAAPQALLLIPLRALRREKGLPFREVLFSLFSVVQKQLFRFLHRLRGSDSLRLCVGGTLLVAHEVHHK